MIFMVCSYISRKHFVKFLDGFTIQITKLDAFT